MKDDPTVKRIREVRHQISEECEHDPKRLIEYYMKRQKECRTRREKKLAGMTSEGKE